MKLGRLVGLVFLAVIAVGGASASSASAVWYQFLGGNLPFTIHLQPGLLLGPPNVACEESLGTGETQGITGVGKLVIKFKGCAAHQGSNVCTIKSSSPAGGNAEIITNTLRGLLGVAEHGTQPAILIQEENNGGTLTTLGATGGTCNLAVETAVKGNVIGLILLASIRHPTLELHVIFGGRHSLLLLNGELDKYTLNAYGANATLDVLTRLLFAHDIEIC